MADFPLGGAAFTESHGFTLATMRGTVITGSASTNTKGAYVELLSAANNISDSIGITIVIDRNSTPQGQILLDIAIGGAGSEEVIIPNLYYYSEELTVFGIGTFSFPISIPSGVRISARCQGSVSSVTPPINIQLTKGSFTSNQSYSEVVAYGDDESTSTGVSVAQGVDSLGSWVEIVAATNEDIFGIVVSAHRAASSWSGGILVYDVAVGSAGNEEAILEGNTITVSSTETGQGLVSVFCPLSISSGSRVSVRVAAPDINSDFTLDFVIYGVK